MASGNSSPGSRQAEKGCLGTRLGEPYIYRWMDQEPTKQTWADLANQRGCLGAFIGVVAVVLVCTLVAGIQGFILGFLFLSGFGALAGLFYRQLGGRTDGGPVPKPVWREAYIEYAWGEFYFVLEVDGKPEIWQPWHLVRQFEKVDFWPMFGDAGASPYKTGWHAIAMTPLVGKPWMIGNTIEAEAEVRERFTELDAQFSADTRVRFMRALEARKSSAERQMVPQEGTETMPGGGMPARAKGIPDKL